MLGQELCLWTSSQTRITFLLVTGVWTQGLTFTRQVLYYLSHTPSPFLL
jgi:hypothetical protein